MPADAPSEPARFRLVAVGDFAGPGSVRSAAASKHERIAVDADAFEGALARIAPRVELELPAIGGSAAEPVELVIESWRDFTPAGVASRVPALRTLLEVRQLLERLERGELGTDAFRDAAAALAPAPLVDELVGLLSASGEVERPARAAGPTPPRPASPETDAGDAVDSILDMVGDEGAGAAAGTSDTARRMVDGILPRRADRPGSGAASGSRQARAAIEARLEQGLRSVLTHPAFRKLEATWRGLRFLVDRTDFRGPVDLEMVSADVDRAPAALASLAEGDDVDVVVADYEFDASARDLGRVQALAEAAAQIQTPVVTALGPAFFDLESWAGLRRARGPIALFDEPARAAWRSFRGDERSRWIVLTVNRLALRAPYGPDGERSRDLAYRDPEDAGVFASAVWAVASVLLRAFVRTGACVQISGTRNGLVPDLALVTPAGESRPVPVEGVIDDERREDLERVGLAVVQQYQRDIAFVGALRTFHKPERFPDAEASADAAQQVTLAYQIFASRFVRFLGRTLPELIGIGSLDEATARLRDAVIAFVSTPAHELRADHVGIAMSPNPDDASFTDIGLRIQPELTIAGRPVNVMLSFSLRL